MMSTVATSTNTKLSQLINNLHEDNMVYEILPFFIQMLRRNPSREAVHLTAVYSPSMCDLKQCLIWDEHRESE